MSETPVRNIRISNELWDQISKVASENGETAAAFIRRAVIRAIKEES